HTHGAEPGVAAGGEVVVRHAASDAEAGDRKLCRQDATRGDESYQDDGQNRCTAHAWYAPSDWTPPCAANIEPAGLLSLTSASRRPEPCRAAYAARVAVSVAYNARQDCIGEHVLRQRGRR